MGTPKLKPTAVIFDVGNVLYGWDPDSFLVRQIAGLIARRIDTYSKEGEQVEQGARMGLMRFGSRMDVFLPLGSPVRVKVGDNVVAGVSVLAELPEP